MSGKVTTLLFSFLFLVVGLSAQTGYVSGSVYDSDGKSTMPGAGIYLKESPSIGTITDLDGTYLLNNLKIGPHTIIISYTGYDSQEIPINIEAGKGVKLDFILKSMSIIGEEIVITAQALGQAKAINQQLNSDALANIVSADKIKELPDVNAAEAISRLPGVAINRSGGEGSKVVVRGLDPKFTAISINGVRLPSTSGTDRSVDLSLISPELLSGIELFKSPTPDMDGDALGGSINLNIIRAPKSRKISVKALGGHNFLSNTTNDYKLTASLAQRIFNGKVGIIATGNTERFNRSGETIGMSWSDNFKVVVDTAKNQFAQRGNALTYRKNLESRKRQNASVGLDYQLGDKTEFNVLGIFSRTTRDIYEHSERYDVAANRITFEPSVSNNSISLYSGSLTASHDLGLVKIDWGTALSKIVGETPDDYTVEFRHERTAFNTAVFNDAERAQPEVFDTYAKPNTTENFLQTLSITRSGNSENIRSAFINFLVPLVSQKALSLSFKTGAKFVGLEKERNFENKRRQQGYYLLNNSHFKDFTPDGIGALGVDPSGGNYYAMSNFTNSDIITMQKRNGDQINLLSSFDTTKLNKFRNIYERDLGVNQYGGVNNYSLTENVYATYAMFKAKVGSKLTIIPGFRYEYSDNTYNGIYSDLSGDLGQSGTNRDTTASINYGVFLPHLHVKYKPFDWFDIRASYSTTLARPDYDYLVPATLVNRGGELDITQGDPELKPSVSTNYDLFFTAYSGKWGLLSIGGFYKQIENAFYPIITGLNNDSLAVAAGFPRVGFVGAEFTSYANSPESYVRGFEVDLQTNLNFLPGFLKGFIFNLNYSRLFSETTINGFTERTEILGRPPFITRKVIITPNTRKVDLIGQASHIFNSSLGYDIKGLSLRASASYQGTKLTGYSAIADKDRFNNGFYRFDFVIKQRFGPNFNIFLNVNNISDQRDAGYFRSPEFITSNARFGQTSTIGAEYVFR